VNKTQITHTVTMILNHLGVGVGRSVAVLGLAYKANTPVVEESAGMRIIDELLKAGVEIIAYDPIALENARARFGDHITYASSVRECLGRSAVCVITTPSDQFSSIRAEDIVHNPTTIIDCWRILDPSQLGERVRYVALGKNAACPR